MTNEGALFLVAVDLLCEQQSSATLVMALVSGEREREGERERDPLPFPLHLTLGGQFQHFPIPR